MGDEISSNFRDWLFSGEIIREGDCLFARLVLFPLFSGFGLGNTYNLSKASL
jgi:hypothetical protein